MPPEHAFPVTIEQTVYPRPDYAFPNARIGLTYTDSAPDFPAPDAAPEGAPVNAYVCSIGVVSVDDARKSPNLEQKSAFPLTSDICWLSEVTQRHQ